MSYAVRVEKPIVSSGDTKYVKLSFLNILSPADYPLTNGCLDPNARRKITTFLIKQFAGKNLQLNKQFIFEIKLIVVV